MIAGIVDGILGLSGVAAYLIVGVLAFAEAAAFIGLVVPGEVAVLLGGVLASQQRVSLPLMLCVTVVAAIAGDSVGYEVGARYGERLLAHRWLRRHHDKIDRARAYLQQRGGRAVFLGRWTSVLRALVPGLAGMSHMPYRRFAAFNILGGTAWATTFTLLGYAAGASYQRVERIAGRASLVLLGLIAVALLLRWAARRAIARQQQLRALGTRLLDTSVARWVQGRFPDQLRWLADRFDPRVSRGLALTTVIAALVAAGWTVGAITQDVYGHDELALVDPTVARWFAAHATDVGAAVARAILDMVRWPWITATFVVAVTPVAVWRGRRAATRVLAGGIGSWAIAAAAQRLLPAPASGTLFPASEPAVAAGLAVMVVAAVGQARGWSAGARAAAVAAMAVVVVGTAGLVTADSALTDVVAGAAVGAVLGVAGRAVSRRLLRSQLLA